VYISFCISHLAFILLEAVRKLSENELLLIEFTPDTDWSLGDPVFVEFGA